MTDHNSVSSHYEHIANELRTMSELITAARDEPPFCGLPALLIMQMPEDESRFYAKITKR